MLLTETQVSKLREWLGTWLPETQGELVVYNAKTSPIATPVPLRAFLLSPLSTFDDGPVVAGPRCVSCATRFTKGLRDILIYEIPRWQGLHEGGVLCEQCGMRECKNCKRKITAAKQQVRLHSLKTNSLCERCATALQTIPPPTLSKLPKWRPKI